MNKGPWNGFACVYPNGRVAFFKSKKQAQAHCTSFRGELFQVVAAFKQIARAQRTIAREAP